MARHNKREPRAVALPSEKSNHDLFGDSTVINMFDAPDELKLSAKLIEVMSPWMEELDLVTLANCASLAWNAAITDNDSYASPDVLRDGVVDDAVQHKALIEKMKKRKIRLFPDDIRTIIRMQIRQQANGEPSLVVASELKPKYMLKALSKLLTSDEA